MHFLDDDCYNLSMPGGHVKNLSGQRFGRLSVVSFVEVRAHKAWWLCRCDCGVECERAGIYLRSRDCRSCGCLLRESRRVAKTRRHGDSGSGGTRPTGLTYSSWQSMKARCYSPRNMSYERYGGRGIAVCDRWRTSYEAFLADLGHRPSKLYSLDRLDPNGNYEPGNVRWATRDEQAGNQRLSNPRVGRILDEMLAASTDLLERGVLLRVRAALLG